MTIPRNIRRGQVLSITMMELRAEPGEVMEAVRDGAIVHVTKQGRHIATIAPPSMVDQTIVVRADGSSLDDRKALTHGLSYLMRN